METEVSLVQWMLGKYSGRLDIGAGLGRTLSVGNRMIKGGFAWLRRIGRNSRRKSESLAIQPCSLFLSTDAPTTHPLHPPLSSFGSYPQSQPLLLNPLASASLLANIVFTATDFCGYGEDANVSELRCDSAEG